MLMLTKEIMRNLPPLYSQEKKGDEAICILKYFTPDSNWTWYALEGCPVVRRDGQLIEVPFADIVPGEEVFDWRFFGWVDGMEFEMGYFLLSELVASRGALGLKIERDLHWNPQTSGQIKAKRKGS